MIWTKRRTVDWKTKKRTRDKSMILLMLSLNCFRSIYCMKLTESAWINREISCLQVSCETNHSFQKYNSSVSANLLWEARNTRHRRVPSAASCRAMRRNYAHFYFCGAVVHSYVTIGPQLCATVWIALRHNCATIQPQSITWVISSYFWWIVVGILTSSVCWNSVTTCNGLEQWESCLNFELSVFGWKVPTFGCDTVESLCIYVTVLAIEFRVLVIFE